MWSPLTDPIIRTENICKEYNDQIILQDINITVERGRMLLIEGRSGSGKTTLLNILGCMDTPTRGKIYIDEKDITKMNHRQLSQLRLHKIGFIFQDHNLIESLTVEENILLPMRIAKHHNGHQRVEELLENFGIGNIRHNKPKQISGGEKQRAAIARALANEPEILLADEPTASLDLENSETVLEAFKKANKEYGATVVMASHDAFLKGGTEFRHFIMKGKNVVIYEHPCEEKGLEEDME